MSTNILVQKIDENYSFTHAGELMAYFYTTSKLLKHYMTKKQGFDQIFVREKLSNLENFLAKNFLKLDDYLNKINLLAEYVDELDSFAFSSFFGKQFLPVLEQTKQQLLDRETPKYRDSFEDPLKMPSHSLLENFESVFIKAPPFVWMPNKDHEEKISITPVASSVKENKNTNEDMIEAPPQKLKTQKMLGTLLLELHEKDFTKAQSLSFPLESELPYQDINQKEVATLDNLGQQISFKEYVQLSNKLSIFIKNKDNKGYETWLLQLEPKFNACITLNQLVSKAKKGSNIDWERQISMISNQLYFQTDNIKKIKNEVIKYQVVLINLQNLLQSLPPNVRQLYSQLILFLDKKDKLENKQAALKIMLLQIIEPTLKDKLYIKVCELIDKLEQ